MDKMSLAAVLLIAAWPAWGQSEEDVTAAVGPQLDAYTACLKQKVYSLAGTLESDDDAIRSAISACANERQNLLVEMQKPPLKTPPADAADAVQGLDESLRPKMLKTLKEARGS